MLSAMPPHSLALCAAPHLWLDTRVTLPCVRCVFGASALNLNIHFHILFLDGVYVTTSDRLTFRRVPPPTVAALEKLVRVISERVGRALERQGLLVRDLENSFLTFDSPDGAGFDDLLGHSIT